MTTHERNQIKAFVDSPDMFAVIRDYILDLTEPQYETGTSLSDFGALVLAHRQMKAKLDRRFDALKIDAQVVQ